MDGNQTSFQVLIAITGINHQEGLSSLVMISVHIKFAHTAMLLTCIRHLKNADINSPPAVLEIDSDLAL
jgi:hypothetical protein